MYDSNYFKKLIGEDINENDYFEQKNNKLVLDENTYQVNAMANAERNNIENSRSNSNNSVRINNNSRNKNQ